MKLLESLLLLCILQISIGISTLNFQWNPTRFTQSDTTNRLTRAILCRGGDKTEIATHSVTESEQNVTVVISVAFGSPFFDKSRSYNLRRNTTILNLKDFISKRFPDCPPAPLIRLNFGLRLLNNSETIGSLSEGPSSHVPGRTIKLFLDNIAGVSLASYSRISTVANAIDAYVAVSAHQLYIAELQRAVLQSLSEDENEFTSEDDRSIHANSVAIGNSFLGKQPLSLKYNAMMRSLNESLFVLHRDSIRRAIELEQDPTIPSPDTAPWLSVSSNEPSRQGSIMQLSPLSTFLAREFDASRSSLYDLGYHSALCWVRRRRYSCLVVSFIVTSSSIIEYSLCLLSIVVVALLISL